jgi:hypothetical protein
MKIEMMVKDKNNNAKASIVRNGNFYRNKKTSIDKTKDSKNQNKDTNLFHSKP